MFIPHFHLAYPVPFFCPLLPFPGFYPAAYSMVRLLHLKKGSCFLLFYFHDLLPSLAARKRLKSPDDQREEFKPRWQRSRERKWLETAPFFVCFCKYRGRSSAQAIERREAAGRRQQGMPGRERAGTNFSDGSLYFISWHHSSSGSFLLKTSSNS